jgi:hypothetical protein
MKPQSAIRSAVISHQRLSLAAIAVLCGLLWTTAYLFVHYGRAASVELYLQPANLTVAQGTSFNTAIRLDTGGASVNAVQANLSYPADKLEYVAVSYAGSSFPQKAEESISTGSIRLARFVDPGGSASGDLLFATVTFKARVSSGSAAVIFADGSAVTSSSGDGSNILSSTSPGTYHFTPPAAPPPPPTQPPAAPPTTPTPPPSTATPPPPGTATPPPATTGRTPSASSTQPKATTTSPSPGGASNPLAGLPTSIKQPIASRMVDDDGQVTIPLVLAAARPFLFAAALLTAIITTVWLLLLVARLLDSRRLRVKPLTDLQPPALVYPKGQTPQNLAGGTTVHPNQSAIATPKHLNTHKASVVGVVGLIVGVGLTATFTSIASRNNPTSNQLPYCSDQTEAAAGEPCKTLAPQ